MHHFSSTFETFVIAEEGRATRSVDIRLVQPSGCHAPLDPLVWPQDSGHNGWWEALPYPIYDMRPEGYLGRTLARYVAPTLHVPENPDNWSDEDIARFLAHYGVP